MGEIVPRWEWRTFASSVATADAVFATLKPAVEASEELYLLTAGGDNVKVRDGLMDIKVLRETDSSGLQRWEPILKAAFPLDEGAALKVFEHCAFRFQSYRQKDSACRRS